MDTGLICILNFNVCQFLTQPFKNQVISLFWRQQVYCCAERAALPLHLEKHQHSAEAAIKTISPDLSVSTQQQLWDSSCTVRAPSTRETEQNSALKTELFPKLHVKHHCCCVKHKEYYEIFQSPDFLGSNFTSLRQKSAPLQNLQISTCSEQRHFFLAKQSFAYHSTLSSIISDKQVHQGNTWTGKFWGSPARHSY